MSIFTLRRDAKKAINVIYSAQPDAKIRDKEC